MARPFFPWVGGKEKLIPYITGIMPDGISQYVEPFGGSGAVLLSMEPKSSRLDIYNDANIELVNLFSCVKEKTNVLMRELKFLPTHSRVEFDWYKDIIEHKSVYFKNIEEERAVLRDRSCFTEEQAEILDPIFIERMQLFDVYRAAAYFKRIWGSFSATTTSFGVKSVNMDNAIKRMLEASKRLEHVVIEHKDAATLVTERDCPDGLVYCDPPYFEAEKYYDAGFGKRDHVRLWRVLKKCTGYVIVSYNNCGYIRNLYKDFYISAFDRQNPMAQKAGAKYGELLITNYDPRGFAGQTTLFGEPLDLGNMRLIHVPSKPLKTI